MIFQDIPGPGIFKKKNPGLSRTFQEAWEPCNEFSLRFADVKTAKAALPNAMHVHQKAAVLYSKDVKYICISRRNHKDTRNGRMGSICQRRKPNSDPLPERRVQNWSIRAGGSGLIVTSRKGPWRFQRRSFLHNTKPWRQR